MDAYKPFLHGPGKKPAKETQAYLKSSFAGVTRSKASRHLSREVCHGISEGAWLAFIVLAVNMGKGAGRMLVLWASDFVKNARRLFAASFRSFWNQWDNKVP